MEWTRKSGFSGYDPLMCTAGFRCNWRPNSSGWGGRATGLLERTRTEPVIRHVWSL